MKGVTKISVCDDISLITFNGIGSDLKFISDVFTTLAAAGINMDMISQTAPTGDKISVSFTVCGHDLIKVLSLIKNYTEKYPKFKPLVTGSNSKIQLFGEEMRHTEGVAAKVFSAVAGAGAQVLMITTSEVDISLLLTSYNLDETLDALQKTFELNEISL
ncbi:MAG: aspartate kinase [Hydrogenoanaerobacterium sp.]